MVDEGVPYAGRDDYVRIGQPAEQFQPRTPIRETSAASAQPELRPVPIEALVALPNPWELWLWLIGLVTGATWLLTSGITASREADAHGPVVGIVAWIADATGHVWPVALGAAAVLAGVDRLHRQRAVLRYARGERED
jgi:hypothetical protein